MSRGQAARRKGTPFVVAAPSGTGKTTVCHAVIARDEEVEFSISHTTRKPRPGERDGVDYHFVGCEEFARLVEAGAFLEHARFGDNEYGTSWESLRGPTEERGRDVLLEIEVQGATQVRSRLTEAKFIFLLPPSMDVLEARLRGRKTESEAAVEARLARARAELDAIDLFDYAVVNDDLEQAISAVAEIIRSERSQDPAALAEVRARYDRARVWRRWREETACERERGSD